ncbi:hydrogenase maturation protease [Dehalococcoidia bacterium]|nr:hydrogenase maturation protease [Dehalococcoidia bacterium]
MKKTLVIGFGNVHRRDDGAGLAVLNALRKEVGRPPLDAEDDGFDDLGHEIDTILLHQLVPELAETVAPYDLVIFVDAHVGRCAIIPELLREEEVIARCKTTIVPHQLHPGMVLALAHQLFGSHARGVLLSIRGYDFDFGEGLSPQTAALVPSAVNRVLALARPSKWNLRVESAAR